MKVKRNLPYRRALSYRTITAFFLGFGSAALLLLSFGSDTAVLRATRSLLRPGYGAHMRLHGSTLIVARECSRHLAAGSGSLAEADLHELVRWLANEPSNDLSLDEDGFLSDHLGGRISIILRRTDSHVVIVVRSPGGDGELGTDDDVSAVLVRK